jgi:hypothetical protein
VPAPALPEDDEGMFITSDDDFDDEDSGDGDDVNDEMMAFMAGRKKRSGVTITDVTVSAPGIHLVCSAAACRRIRWMSPASWRHGAEFVFSGNVFSDP